MRSIAREAVRCRRCGRLLFETDLATGAAWCPRCKTWTTFGR